MSMRKEVITAIVFGLLAGLLITFVTYYLQNKSRSQDSQNQSVTEKIVLDTSNAPLNGTPTGASLVKITAPENESVATEKNAELRGEAFARQPVVIFVNDDDQIIMAAEDGTFELAITLESGSNVLSAHAINPETGETISHQITIVHSNKSLEETLVTDQEVREAAKDQP